MTYYHTPLRSSLPMEQWRREADAVTRRRDAAKAASRQRERSQQREHEAAANAVAHTAATQLVTLRSEFVQQQDTLREAMVAYVVEEFEALRKELRIDAERQLKQRLAELERTFEAKLAGLRPPTIRGTYAEDKHYTQHDIVARNGGSFISRKDAPGVCPGPDWQQLTQPGRTGPKGERGYTGERGAKGETGAQFVCWKVDRKNFVVVPLMSDGREGPRLHLRELFEEYHNQAASEPR